MDADRAARERRILSTAAELRVVVGETTVTVESPDGAVVVTAGPRNALLDLTLTRRIRHHDGRALGALLVATVRAAAERADELLTERARELVPGRADLPDPLASALPEPPPPPADDTADEETDPLVRRLRDEARRQLDAWATTRADVVDLTATAHATQGGVVAEVGATGELRRVELADTAPRLDPAQLATLVRDTVRRATADAAALLAERVQRVAGSRLDLVSLVATYRPSETDDEEGRGG
ncbi:YbaB/EbfC family nucleoid-associated protein [Micromonospora sp. DT228]|uniref:YbaB/EbfC family nucleoid-associated protein n=1 Tax=Micromonospora sp. DT228 TaxID=3393443 RepID=UPI003CEAB48F